MKSILLTSLMLCLATFNLSYAQSVTIQNKKVNFSQENMSSQKNRHQTKGSNFTCAGCGPNLVPNPDLEATNPIYCNINGSNNSEIYIDRSAIADWVGGAFYKNNPPRITPDYWSYCPSANSTPSILSPQGCSGHALGFFTYLTSNTLEFVQAELIQTLTAGKEYCLTFDAFTYDMYPPADGLNVLLLPNHLNVDSVKANGGTFPGNPVYNHPSGSFIPYQCTNFSSTFTALGNERWIAFGNMDQDSIQTSNGGPGNSYVLIDNISLIELNSSLSVTAMEVNPSDCRGQNGEATATSSGGTPPFSYQWESGQSGPIGQSGQTVTGLTNGAYNVTVTDSGGCVGTASVVINDGPKLLVHSAVEDASCNAPNGEIRLVTTGGTPGYTYLWNNGATTSDITGLAMGTYLITLTDANGCCVIQSHQVGMDDCCTSNDCVDAIQGTLNICAAINTDPTIPLGTVDCDGDGVTNADECADATNPLDPCDYVNTSITLPVIADQSGCAQPCPDLTPTTTVLPGNIAGISSVEVVVVITELNGINSDGTTITVRIPVDPRLVFVWNIGLTQVGGIPVQNSDWNYLGSNGVFHNWTYNGNGQIINGGSSSALGFQGFYDPQGTDGQTTITVTIVPGSGGDCNFFNNTDSERLVYFR